MANRIDIQKGRYWDRPLSLVDGCTPCSPGCDHCWSAGMTHRFNRYELANTALEGPGVFTDSKGCFTGAIETRPDRLDIPLRRRKPTVFAVWNDLFHEDVNQYFRAAAYGVASLCPHHAFLILTKRPIEMLKWHTASRTMNHWIVNAAIPVLREDCLHNTFGIRDKLKYLWPLPNVFNGLTVCNQQEWDEKEKYFSMIPGKKFLSIEPMLGAIDLKMTKVIKEPFFGWPDSEMEYKRRIDGVILGGETGAGARPMHPDWVRSIRDQCAAAGVKFFFKQWGTWAKKKYDSPAANIGRLLDGKEYNDLPWKEGGDGEGKSNPI